MHWLLHKYIVSCFSFEDDSDVDYEDVPNKYDMITMAEQRFKSQDGQKSGIGSCIFRNKSWFFSCIIFQMIFIC